MFYSLLYKPECKFCLQFFPRMGAIRVRNRNTRALFTSVTKPNFVQRLLLNLKDCRFVGRCYMYGDQTSTELSISERRKQISRSRPIAKITRCPFVKDLFLSKFDQDVLAFPEVLDSAHIKEINDMAVAARGVVTGGEETDDESRVSPAVIQRFKDLGYFGLQIPVEYDGAELLTTEAMRMTEGWGVDLSLALAHNSHHAVSVYAVMNSGSEEIKKKYLPPLARGEKIAGFCLTESCSGSDPSLMETTFKPVDGQDNKYVLNGTKTWVTNGGLADVFLVFGKLPMKTAMGEIEHQITAALVDRDRHGLTTEPIGNTHGVRGLTTSTVHLKDVPITSDDFIGEAGKGLKVANDVMTGTRLAIGGMASSMIKEIIGLVSEHCINKKSHGKQLMDFELVQNKIARMVCTAYAIESMTYLTAGLYDSTQDPDLLLESALVKVYSSEGLWECAHEAMQILGSDAYKQGRLVEKWLRDSRALLLIDGSNDILRMHVGLLGLSHAGEESSETIRKLRNSLYHPWFTFKKMIEMHRYTHGKMKLDLDLCGYLHLSLKASSDLMEESVKRFSFAVGLVLTRHGSDTAKSQMDLIRLADIAMEIYCMAAVLSRASRTYCIGLRNETHELNIANSICRDSYEKITGHLLKINTGPFGNNDTNFKIIAEQTFKDRGYSAVSPITRNW